MDGTANLAAACALRRSATEAILTLRVVRDAHGLACDLTILKLEAVSADPEALDELVRRSLRDVYPEIAEEMTLRLGTANDEVCLRGESVAPGKSSAVTARPTSEPDVWTASFRRVGGEAVDRAGDARLRELNHRVINSLTMLSSIIGIESRGLGDPDGRAALDRVRSRLVAVSNLYRILSAADAGAEAGPDSGAVIVADTYLRSVADAVAASVGSGERIAVEVRAEPVRLGASQAATLGLIANEAMTNAYKHAFPGRRRGRIVVAFGAQAETLTLRISDDGVGMPADARGGLGTTLIEAFAIDLAGEVSVQSGGEGTSVRLVCPRAG